jgi:hypothetical protein
MLKNYFQPCGDQGVLYHATSPHMGWYLQIKRLRSLWLLSCGCVWRKALPKNSVFPINHAFERLHQKLDMGSCNHARCLPFRRRSQPLRLSADDMLCRTVRRFFPSLSVLPSFLPFSASRMSSARPTGAGQASPWTIYAILAKRTR